MDVTTVKSYAHLLLGLLLAASFIDPFLCVVLFSIRCFLFILYRLRRTFSRDTLLFDSARNLTATFVSHTNLHPAGCGAHLANVDVNICRT